VKTGYQEGTSFENKERKKEQKILFKKKGGRT
jgi:hypothetical protein